jgi:hypothetical protein
MSKIARVAALSGLPLFALIAAYAINPGTSTGNWTGVGKLGFGTPTTTYTVSGVAIDEYWILSSNHGVSSISPKYQIDSGATYNGVAVYRNRWGDLSLIQLSDATQGVQVYHPIYEDFDEQGKTIYMQGYGLAGTYNTSTCHWDDQQGTYGTNRDGTNIVSGVTTSSIYGDFDGFECNGNPIDPLSDGGPTTLECGVANGDSGGPSFISQGGVAKVAGIHSSGGGGTGSGFGDARVSKNKLWIAGVKAGAILTSEEGIMYFVPGNGNILSGYVDEMMVSDDQRMSVQYQPPTYGPDVEFVVKGRINWSPSSFSFKVEAQVPQVASGLSINQKVEMYNWSTSQWEQKDLRAATASDSTVTVTISSNAGNYIGSSPGFEVWVRLNWAHANNAARATYDAKIDRVFWY